MPENVLANSHLVEENSVSERWLTFIRRSRAYTKIRSSDDVANLCPKTTILIQDLFKYLSVIEAYEYAGGDVSGLFVESDGEILSLVRPGWRFRLQIPRSAATMQIFMLFIFSRSAFAESGVEKLSK